jgi:hypothetical protein
VLYVDSVNSLIVVWQLKVVLSMIWAPALVLFLLNELLNEQRQVHFLQTVREEVIKMLQKRS